MAPLIYLCNGLSYISGPGCFVGLGPNVSIIAVAHILKTGVIKTGLVINLVKVLGWWINGWTSESLIEPDEPVCIKFILRISRYIIYFRTIHKEAVGAVAIHHWWEFQNSGSIPPKQQAWTTHNSCGQISGSGAYTVRYANRTGHGSDSRFDRPGRFGFNNTAQDDLLSK